MSEPLGENGSVRFSVKELLAKLDGKLDVISEKLDAKADEAHLVALEARVLVLEGSAATEAQLADYRRKQADERKRDRRWLMVFGTSTVLSGLGLLATTIFNTVQ